MPRLLLIIPTLVRGGAEKQLTLLACGLPRGELDVHVAVLTGAGRAFSSGQDLGEMARLAAGTQSGSGFPALLDALQAFDKPLVAAVNGAAIGIGFTLLPHCDLVLAADSARFRTPFAEMGVPPEAASSVLFPERMGAQQAARVLFTSAWLSAEEAVSLGVALRVVPAADLMKEARALAARIAAQPPAALRMTKRLLREGQRAEFDTLMELSAAAQAIAHQTEDHRDALDAFLNKRDPVFRGR